MTEVAPSRASSRNAAIFFAAVAAVVLLVTWFIGRDLLGKVKGDVYNLRAFQHLFVRFDLPGAAWGAGVLVGALLLVRFVSATRADAVAEWIGAHRRMVALLVVALLSVLAPVVYQDYPLAIDEFAPYLQAQVFAAGKLYIQYPPELISRLLPVGNQFFRLSTITGQAIEGNYPSWAAILTPFMWLGVPWLANPIACGGVVLLMGKAADRLFPDQPTAAGWAILLTIASPVVTLNALSYYTMNLHLLVALAYAVLLLQPTPMRLVAAGLVGSLGLTLNNPLPHAVNAVPWILWIAWRPGRVRHLALLGAGYLPAVAIAAFWLHAHGQVPLPSAAAVPTEAPVSRSLMEGILDQLRNGALGVPEKASDLVPFLTIRAIWLSKVYLWSVPGLACIALLGFLHRRADPRFRVLAGSFACIAAAYLFVKVDQGHGWGSRYFHPAFGVLPLLGTAWLLSDPVGIRWRRYFLVLAAASLCVLTPLRMGQARTFIAEARAQTPEHDPSRPQVVFVALRPAPGRYYPWDAVRNDPFLRGNTLVLPSSGDAADAELVERMHPGATLASGGLHGTVWNLP